MFEFSQTSIIFLVVFLNFQLKFILLNFFKIINNSVIKETVGENLSKWIWLKMDSFDWANVDYWSWYVKISFKIVFLKLYDKSWMVIEKFLFHWLIIHYPWNRSFSLKISISHVNSEENNKPPYKKSLLWQLN